MNVSKKYRFMNAFLALSLCAIPVIGLSASSEKRAPMKLEGKETLQLRVLSRAFSHIYKGPDVKSGTIQENVRRLNPITSIPSRATIWTQIAGMKSAPITGEQSSAGCLLTMFSNGSRPCA